MAERCYSLNQKFQTHLMKFRFKYFMNVNNDDEIWRCVDQREISVWSLWGEKNPLGEEAKSFFALGKKNILLGSEDQQHKYIIHFVICFSSMQCACFWNKQQIHWEFAFFVVFFLLFISGCFFLCSENNIFSCLDSGIA